MTQRTTTQRHTERKRTHHFTLLVTLHIVPNCTTYRKQQKWIRRNAPMLTAPVRETALVETTANVASQKTRLNPLEDAIIHTARYILLCAFLFLEKSHDHISHFFISCLVYLMWLWKGLCLQQTWY